MSQQTSPRTWWLNPWWLGAVLALLANAAYAVVSTVCSVVFFETPSFDGVEVGSKTASSMRWSMATDLWPINVAMLFLAGACAWVLISAHRRLPDFPWRAVAVRAVVLFIPAIFCISLVILGVALLVYGGTSFTI